MIKIFSNNILSYLENDINERVSSRNRATPHVYIKQKPEDK